MGNSNQLDPKKLARARPGLDKRHLRAQRPRRRRRRRGGRRRSGRGRRRCWCRWAGCWWWCWQPRPTRSRLRRRCWRRRSWSWSERALSRTAWWSRRRPGWSSRGIGSRSRRRCPSARRSRLHKREMTKVSGRVEGGEREVCCWSGRVLTQPAVVGAVVEAPAFVCVSGGREKDMYARPSMGDTVRDDVLPPVALALVVVVAARSELGVLALETGLDDVGGGALARRLGHGGRRQEGDGEQEGLHFFRTTRFLSSAGCANGVM